MLYSDLPLVSYQRAEAVPASRAIFDREASVLIVNLEKPNDYSGEFINSELLCISLDSEMMMEDLELKFGTSDIKKLNGIEFPMGIPAGVKFQESYVTTEQVAEVYADIDLSFVHVRYAVAEEEELLHLQVAEGIIFDVSLDNRLLGVWIKDVIVN